MQFHARVPRAPLDEAVTSIWVFESGPRPHGLEKVLPSGRAQLIINLQEDQTRDYDPTTGLLRWTTSGSILAGVRAGYGVIDTAEQECVVGAVFSPGGTASLFGVPGVETRESDVPLDALWSRQDVAWLRERLLGATGAAAMLDILEDALGRAWRQGHADPIVRHAVRTFDRAPHLARVEAVADEVGLSRRRFIERFDAAVGLTPKRYCRLQRFQRALSAARRGSAVNWAALAADCGYYDQSHFTHEFREFSGLTPTGYDQVRTVFQNHVTFLQDP